MFRLARDMRLPETVDENAGQVSGRRDVPPERITFMSEKPRPVKRVKEINITFKLLHVFDLEPHHVKPLLCRCEVVSVDHLIAGRLIRNTHVLRLKRAARTATVLDLRQEIFPRLRLAPLCDFYLVDGLDKSLRNRVHDGCAVETDLRFQTVPARLAELCKLAVLTALGVIRRYEFELPAPRGAGIRHIVDCRLIGMQVPFVDQDVAALTGKSKRIRGQRINARPVFELDDTCRDPSLFVHDLDQIAVEPDHALPLLRDFPRRFVGFFRPVRNVIDHKLFRRDFIPRTDPLDELRVMFTAPQTLDARPV